MSPVQIGLTLAGTIIVIIAAYYATYYISVRSSGRSRGRGGNINVLDRFAISRDKSFCLVEINGKVYVVGVTNQSMTLLDTLDAGDFAEAAAERSRMMRWPGTAGRLQNSIIDGLASFLSGKNRTRGRDEGAGAGTFAENMESARKKSGSETGRERTDGVRDKQPDDPGGEG